MSELNKIVEAWYFTETVEGISDIEDFLHCKYQIENIGFQTWLKEQELEDDFENWLKQHGILYEPVNNQTTVYRVIDDVDSLNQILNTCNNGSVFVSHKVAIGKEHLQKAKENKIAILLVKDSYLVSKSSKEVKAYVNDTVFNKPVTS